MTNKAIISNRIYFRPSTDKSLKEVMTALTYKIEGKLNPRTKIRPVELIRNYKLLPNGVMSIPQGRVDLIPEGFTIEDKRVYHSVPFPTPKFPLREAQVPVYNEVTDTCFINAMVGWGKTFVSLHIARKLGQKTLIVTHTTALRDQWIEEITKLFGMPPGIIGSSKFDIEDHFLVVGNVQTVVKHISKICKEFGTVILDEGHHVPASTFSNIIDGMYSRYRIGLSGTMNRTDGKHILFKDYFGSIVHKPPQSDTMEPTIKLVPTGVHLTYGANWAKKINDLLYDEDYQKFIASLAITQINSGHSVLIPADRVEFLYRVKEYIGSDCLLITGETPFEERKAGFTQIDKGEKMCIAGSRQIFSEGLSVNRISCIILAVPTSNPIILEQIIGRAMRQHPDKLNPVIYDLQFSSPAERKQNNARLAFYVSKGWTVTKV